MRKIINFCKESKTSLLKKQVNNKNGPILISQEINSKTNDTQEKEQFISFLVRVLHFLQNNFLSHQKPNIIIFKKTFTLKL